MRHSIFRIVLVLSAAIVFAQAPWAGSKDKEDPKEKETDEQIAEAKKQSIGNLRKLAVAMHNFHADYNRFPFWCESPNNLNNMPEKPLLSWRVALLPYLEQAELYNKFKQDEPWDSETNKKLAAKIPKVFAPVRGEHKKGEVTFYQVFVTGKESKVHSMFQEAAVTLMTVTANDGTSQTIMIAEAGDPVPWTKPADMPFHSEKELPKVGGLFEDGFHAAFGDTQVAWIKKGWDEKLLRAAIGYDDQVNFDKKKLTGK